MMRAGEQMALLGVNAAAGAAGHVPAGDGTLDGALDALPLGRPVTIMIHGYRFCPFSADHDPHRHILSLTPRSDCWKAVSWPRHLHLDRPGTGLGIGFGWPARGALPRVAWRAHDAGRGLGRMIDAIHRARPDVPVQIVAHSLGARVALTALETAPPAVIRRMIVMSGAEYRGAAERALTRHAASDTKILNVTSGENAAFDLMFRLAVAPPRPLDRPLSAGLRHRAGCIDLAIDAPGTRGAPFPWPPAARARNPHLPLVGLHAAGPLRRLSPDARSRRSVLRRDARACADPHHGGAQAHISPHQIGSCDCKLGRPVTGVGMQTGGNPYPGPPPSGFCNRTRLS
jgi:pimeloyl-ACP methyl ester carboxylesterase